MTRALPEGHTERALGNLSAGSDDGEGSLVECTFGAEKDVIVLARMRGTSSKRV